MNSFALALVRCFEQLSVEPLTPALHDTIRGFAYAIAEHPMEILPEVPETLADLAQRHHLFLVTKGNITEQTGKFERSGLKAHFTAIEVLAEKDAATYRGVVEKYGLVRDLTWMIGNSPKSDINPALEAGLHAVFVPHHNTWMLERGEVRPNVGNGRLLQVESFATCVITSDSLTCCHPERSARRFRSLTRSISVVIVSGGGPEFGRRSRGICDSTDG